MMIFMYSKIIQEPVVITLNFERPDAKQTVAEISFQLELFLSGTLFPSHWLIVRHLSNSIIQERLKMPRSLSIFKKIS